MAPDPGDTKPRIDTVEELDRVITALVRDYALAPDTSEAVVQTKPAEELLERYELGAQLLEDLRARTDHSMGEEILRLVDERTKLLDREGG
jgi:hypothetical protein